MNALSAHELCAEAHAVRPNPTHRAVPCVLLMAAALQALHDTEAAVAARRSVLRAAEDAADSQRVAWALIRLGCAPSPRGGVPCAAPLTAVRRARPGSEAHVQLGDFAAASAQFLDAFLRLEGDDVRPCVCRRGAAPRVP